VRAVVLFLAVLGFVGIRSTPLLARIDQRKLAQIVEGKTTEARVLRLLGEPQARYVHPDGTTTYAYYPRMSRSEWVTIVFAKNAIVTALQTAGEKFSGKDVALDLLRVFSPGSLGRQPDPAKWARIQPGRTTEAQLIQLLGRPRLNGYASTGIRTHAYLYDGPLTGHQDLRAVAIDSTGTVLSWTSGSFTFAAPRKPAKRPFDSNRRAMIVEGKTTDKEVVDLVGPPTAGIANPDGTRTCTYSYVTGKTDASEYSIQLDAAGTVTGRNWCAGEMWGQTQASCADAVRQRVRDPIGTTRTAFLLVDQLPPNAARGYVPADRGGFRREPTVVPPPGSDGGAHSTVGDLFLFDRELHYGRLFTERSRRLMMTPDLNGYGDGLSIKPPDEHVSKRTSIGYTGGLADRSTVLRHFVDDDVTLVVLTNLPRAAFASRS
jgi:hypothetical protein